MIYDNAYVQPPPHDPLGAAPPPVRPRAVWCGTDGTSGTDEAEEATAATAAAPARRPHWAAALVGLPYRDGATGPDAYDCWGLARHVLTTAARLPMPEAQHAAAVIASPADTLAAARDHGWRRIAPPLHRPALPQVWDVWLITWQDGSTHIGVVVQGRAALRLLHADGREGRGSVRADDLQAVARETRRIEVWRHPDATARAAAAAAHAAAHAPAAA
jgi:hypothetical protein